MIKKFLIICSILIFTLCLTSCNGLDIPDGDIKDFVSKFDGDYAFANVLYGQSFSTNIKYDKDENETGRHESYTCFDMRNDQIYRCLKTKASGEFYGEEATYNFQDQIIVCYTNKNETSDIYSKQLTDGIYQDLEYRYQDVMTFVTNFFYSEVTAGFHLGGFYYGDYILKNINKYYKQFSLNEEKTELSYWMNTADPTENGNEIFNQHEFIVNQYGMVLRINTTSYYIVGDKIDSKLVTTITCDYVTEFEKILEL